MPPRTIASPCSNCGNATPPLPESGAVADISDFRPTMVSDPRPVFHPTLHEDELVLTSYLGFGRNVGDLRTMAVSGPVLKYVPAAYALLGVPDLAANPADTPRAEVACTWALAFLFNEKTRVLLPDTLETIQNKYRVNWHDLRHPKAQEQQIGNIKKRGQMLAALLLAMYRDILAAQQMSSELFECTFMPYAMILEDRNPWDAPVYILPMIPAASIAWPDWNPFRGSCGCNEICEPMQEHDVEMYHRCLAFLRYTLIQLEPNHYYKHIGKCMKNQADAQVALLAVARVKREQMQEVAEARQRLEEEKARKKAERNAFSETLPLFCLSPIDELAHLLSDEYLMTVPQENVSEYQDRVKKVFNLARAEYPSHDLSKEEQKIMLQSFPWTTSDGPAAANDLPDRTDEDKAVHGMLHRLFVLPAVRAKDELEKEGADLVADRKMVEAQVAETKDEKHKADARPPVPAPLLMYHSDLPADYRNWRQRRQQQEEEELARMAELD
ncbi:hypothetical protein ACHAQA_002103 [Verticillium albo-atrum]